MDGIVLVDKEVGFTSFDVCNIVKRNLHVSKVGHSGTLDPFATGLLLITTGKATKVNQFLETLDKEYIATLCLGKRTSTLDTEGEVIEEREVNEFSIEQINKAFTNLIGEIEQVPPMFSALKVNGKKLYEYAREGKEIERKIRKITILSIELLEYNHPFVTFKVHCSKGTYVRTLGEQIAEKLNTIGYLTYLRRTKVGRFSVEDANTIKEVRNNENIRYTPILEGLRHFNSIIVNDKLKLDIMNGKKIKLNKEGDILAITQDNEALAVLEKNEIGLYKVKRGLW